MQRQPTRAARPPRGARRLACGGQRVRRPGLARTAAGVPRRARRGRGLPGPGGAIALRQGRHARHARLGRRLGERDPAVAGRACRRLGRRRRWIHLRVRQRDGPGGMRSHFAANFPATWRILWRPVAGDVAAGGDLGFTVGEAEIHTVAPDGAPRTSYTKYLTVWRRTDAGEWRYVIDGGNDRPQP